jgi:hypothetical protein
MVDISHKVSSPRPGVGLFVILRLLPKLVKLFLGSPSFLLWYLGFSAAFFGSHALFLPEGVRQNSSN